MPDDWGAKSIGMRFIGAVSMIGAVMLSACASMGYEPATPEFLKAIAASEGHTKARPISSIAVSDQWPVVTGEQFACVRRSNSKYELYGFTKGTIVYSNPEDAVCKTLQSYRPLPPI
jgi:hypothetical protein